MLRHLLKNSALVLALILFPSFLSAAPLPCPSSVSGTVVLTDDMTCVESNALQVAADNTKIYLNGHTLQCLGPGLNGSCQKIVDPVNPGGPGLPPFSYIGIVSNGHSNVRVIGPGTIDGFGIGISLTGGDDLRVSNVTVTGPAQPAASTNERLAANGIMIVATACGNGNANVVLLDGNVVNNQRNGIALSNAECVKISDNHLHDNNSQFGDAHGLNIANSRLNTATKNIIERNGANRLGGVSDSGIQLLNGATGDTFGNEIVDNFVSDNCGDGIAAVVGAHDNTVKKNSARFNSTSTAGGQCLLVPVGVFFDLAERSAGPGNVWHPNNQCRTNSATIPPGVCNPSE